jgi:hypothetical protein
MLLERRLVLRRGFIKYEGFRISTSSLIQWVRSFAASNWREKIGCEAVRIRAAERLRTWRAVSDSSRRRAFGF